MNRAYLGHFARLNFAILAVVLLDVFLFVLVFQLFRSQFQTTSRVWLAFLEDSSVLAVVANSIYFVGLLLERWVSPAKPDRLRRVFFWLALGLTIPLIIALPCLSALFASMHIEAY